MRGALLCLGAPGTDGLARGSDGSGLILGSLDLELAVSMQVLVWGCQAGVCTAPVDLLSCSTGYSAQLEGPGGNSRTLLGQKWQVQDTTAPVGWVQAEMQLPSSSPWATSLCALSAGERGVRQGAKHQ